jgi:hypothetical protein
MTLPYLQGMIPEVPPKKTPPPPSNILISAIEALARKSTEGAETIRKMGTAQKDAWKKFLADPNNTDNVMGVAGDLIMPGAGTTRNFGEVLDHLKKAPPVYPSVETGQAGAAVWANLLDYLAAINPTPENVFREAANTLGTKSLSWKSLGAENLKEVLSTLFKADKDLFGQTPFLPMDEASRMNRAAQLGFTTDAFHGIREIKDPKVLLPFPGGEVKDIPAVHVGTQRAAIERVSGDPFSKVLPLKVKIESPLTPETYQLPDAVMDRLRKFPDYIQATKINPQAYNENQLHTLMGHLQEQLFGSSPSTFYNPAIPEKVGTKNFIRDVLGFDAIPYINAGEDVGSVSHMMLKPENIRHVSADFDPARVGSTNLMAGLMGGLSLPQFLSNNFGEKKKNDPKRAKPPRS